MGPVFRDTRLLGANATVDPVSDRDWIYRRLPWPAQLAVAYDADATGVEIAFVLGSDVQIGPQDPVPAGGTAGQFPNRDQDFQILLGAQGDLVKALFTETAGVATTNINLVIRLTPLVG